MLGNVWPKNNVAYPDFLDPTSVTNQWWINEFYLFYNNVLYYLSLAEKGRLKAALLSDYTNQQTSTYEKITKSSFFQYDKTPNSTQNIPDTSINHH